MRGEDSDEARQRREHHKPPLGQRRDTGSCGGSREIEERLGFRRAVDRAIDGGPKARDDSLPGNGSEASSAHVDSLLHALSQSVKRFGRLDGAVLAGANRAAATR